LVGQDNLRDHAIGEEVEAQLGDSAQLQYRLERLSEDGAKQVRYRLEITNANDRPAPDDIRMQQSDGIQHAQTCARSGMQKGDRVSSERRSVESESVSTC